jgi:heavy metal sensor kinase
MILNSIRWRLQVWYGLILLFILAGFGFTAYQMERTRRLRAIDDELQRRIAAVSGAFGQSVGDRRGPPGGPGNFRPPFERPDGGEPPDDTDQSDGPPRRPAPNARPRDPNGPRIGDFRLSPRAAALFDETDTNAFYYVIWRRDGVQLAGSTNAPSGLAKPDASGEEHPRAATIGDQRQMFHFTPPGEVMVVGHNLAPELKDLRRTALRLTAVGGAVLLLGLAGGWWLASRAIRPIRSISDTAARISAGDLSQRINAADRESEFGELSDVLNSTFARLEAAFAQQKQFASDAAHELRTPISVLLTQTQSVLNRERSPEEYRQSLHACQRAAQRMRRLIESLLELARLDAGQEQMKHTCFNLSQLVKERVNEIQPLADQRDITMTCDLPDVEYTGDSERLGRVITNLLTNAIHYNRDAGKVYVGIGARNGTIVVDIADTGEGIPVDELPKLFKRFYRAEKSRTDGRSGLGLAISKAIVEAHGGTITVASEVDKGTCFEIRLPAPGNTMASPVTVSPVSS